jgi:hypothetical protein
MYAVLYMVHVQYLYFDAVRITHTQRTCYEILGVVLYSEQYSLQCYSTPYSSTTGSTPNWIFTTSRMPIANSHHIINLEVFVPHFNVIRIPLSSSRIPTAVLS